MLRVWAFVSLKVSCWREQHCVKSVGICVIKGIVLEGISIVLRVWAFVSLKASCWREQHCVKSVGNLCH